MGKNLVAAQRQIGAVQLQQKPGVHNGLILPFHYFRQGVQILLVAGVVFVMQETGNLPRRRRGHKHFLCRRVSSRRFQVLNILLHRRPVRPGNRTGAGRTRLEGRGKGFQQFRQFRKLRVAHSQRRTFSVKAGQPVFHIHRIIHPTLLPVIDNIQPHRRLPRRHFSHGVPHRGVEVGAARQTRLLLLDQQIQHPPGPGQAAGMGGQNPLNTPFHSRFLPSYRRIGTGIPGGNCSRNSRA